eukprot:352915-Chlamydomonas_euryale.AAC.13
MLACGLQRTNRRAAQRASPSLRLFRARGEAIRAPATTPERPTPRSVGPATLCTTPPCIHG